MKKILLGFAMVTFCFGFINASKQTIKLPPDRKDEKTIFLRAEASSDRLYLGKFAQEDEGYNVVENVYFSASEKTTLFVCRPVVLKNVAFENVDCIVAYKGSIVVQGKEGVQIIGGSLTYWSTHKSTLDDSKIVLFSEAVFNYCPKFELGWFLYQQDVPDLCMINFKGKSFIQVNPGTMLTVYGQQFISNFSLPVNSKMFFNYYMQGVAQMIKGQAYPGPMLFGKKKVKGF